MQTHPSRPSKALWFCMALLAAMSGRPAMAQFSPTEGFTADGKQHFSIEVAPYLFLPNVSATVGLAHPPGTDISVNQNRPTVAKLFATLNRAFVGDALVRYGDYSAEANLIDISATVRTQYPSLTPGGSGATLKTTASAVLLQAGMGYRVYSSIGDTNLSVDARAGISYNDIYASAGFERSFFGGVSHTYTFVQPWIGTRVEYFPTPKWRVMTTLALSGLGVDGGTIGWNGRVGASYLVTNWFDVNVGYFANQTRRAEDLGPRGENRSLNLLSYGPLIALGFRF